MYLLMLQFLYLSLLKRESLSFFYRFEVKWKVKLMKQQFQACSLRLLGGGCHFVGGQRGIVYFACFTALWNGRDPFICFSTFGIQTSRLSAANENLLKIFSWVRMPMESREVSIFQLKAFWHRVIWHITYWQRINSIQIYSILRCCRHSCPRWFFWLRCHVCISGNLLNW